MCTQTNSTVGLIATTSGTGSAKRNRTRPSASTPPTSCISTNIGTDAGAMPAKVSENIRATVTAGLAKLVELVNQYAAMM